LIEGWLKEIKKDSAAEELGMILVHNGIVRASSKEGKPVHGMKTTYSASKLDETIALFRQKNGIVDIKVWINEGILQVGDDIMKVCVAGRFRTDVLPVFQELLAAIKSEIIKEEEYPL
jgi:molybdopterin synthase catalytic subunit